jgi:hypothetical protein
MRIASETGWRLLVVAGAVALAAAAVLQAPAAGAVGGGGRPVAVTGTRTRLAPVSSGNLRAIADRGRTARPLGAGDRRGAVSGLPGAGQRGTAAGGIPDPRSVPVVASTPGLRGFPGLRAADNGTESNPEPPDQALCVGGGQVMEAVNAALTVYSTGGTQQVPVVSLTEFFGIPDGGPILPIVFDPSCQFDQQVRRWFVVATEFDLDLRSGTLTGSHLFLAVSKTADATGGYAIFAVNTTAGDATDHGCPCFDDFPALGADAHGLFVTTNRKTLSTGRGNGAQIYAVAKRGLAAVATGSGPPPVLVSFDAGSVGGAPAAAVHPAITPPGGAFPPGRQYFVSLAHSPSAAHHRIAVWALAGTSSLSTARPRLRLSHAILDTLPYARPPKTVQQPGPHPLGQSVGEPVRPLDSGLEIPRQVTFAAGRLWTSIDTAIGPPGGPQRTGVLWLVVTPTFDGQVVGGRVSRQGYLAVHTNSLLYSAVAVNARGAGAMVMSLAGPATFPSAAYAAVRGGRVSGPVRVMARGVRPYDGEQCYRAFGGDIALLRGCRWGDYSAARAGGRGRIWMATEYIPQLPRAKRANWGTFIGRLGRPHLSCLGLLGTRCRPRGSWRPHRPGRGGGAHEHR